MQIINCRAIARKRLLLAGATTSEQSLVALVTTPNYCEIRDNGVEGALEPLFVTRSVPRAGVVGAAFRILTVHVPLTASVTAVGGTAFRQVVAVMLNWAASRVMLAAVIVNGALPVLVMVTTLVSGEAERLKVSVLPRNRIVDKLPLVAAV